MHTGEAVRYSDRKCSERGEMPNVERGAAWPRSGKGTDASTGWRRRFLLRNRTVRPVTYRRLSQPGPARDAGAPGCHLSEVGTGKAQRGHEQTLRFAEGLGMPRRARDVCGSPYAARRTFRCRHRQTSTRPDQRSAQFGGFLTGHPYSPRSPTGLRGAVACASCTSQRIGAPLQGAAAQLFVAADAGGVVRFNQPLRPGAAEHGVGRRGRGCWSASAFDQGGLYKCSLSRSAG